LPEESFSIRDFGVTIAKMLGLQLGETIELKRNRENPNAVLVLRHPKEE